MDKELLKPVRGMRDFYPPDMRKRNKLFQTWSTVAEKFGFEQYDASLVETLDLLKRKSGEEITEQIYCFRDKSNRELALRPEMTPSLTRMVLSKGLTPNAITKWYFVGQCFRYERMTTGRKREHYQLNLDILGESSQIAEAEVLAAAINILKNLGLTSEEVQVRVGSRKLLSELLELKEFSREEMEQAYLGIDKRGKISDEEIASLLKESGLSDEKIKTVFSVLGLKSFDSIKSYMAKNTPGIEEMELLFVNAKAFDIDDFLVFDIAIVRGLSYYTGIVFECFDREKKFRAIFGGGRYDNLFKQMGDVFLPAVGLGFGDVVIDEVLKYYKKEIPCERDLDYVVAYTDSSLAERATHLSQTLRNDGFSVYLLFGAQRMKKILKLSDQLNAKKVAILDPHEVSNNQYFVRDLVNQSQNIETL